VTAHIVIGALSETKAWRDAVHCGGVGAAFGFIGLLVGALVETVRATRTGRTAQWGEPTLWGTVLFGAFGAIVEALGRAGLS
jgi:hypothetical protein